MPLQPSFQASIYAFSTSFGVAQFGKLLVFDTALSVYAREVKILPVVDSESEEAQIVSNYLVDAFIEDCVKRRLGIEKSGWRSLLESLRELERPSGVCTEQVVVRVTGCLSCRGKSG